MPTSDVEPPIAGYFLNVRHRMFAGLAVLALVMAVAVGFFLRGGNHGLYMDDYSDKAWAFDFTAGGWKLNLHPLLNIRPLAYIAIANSVNAIPEHEHVARFVILCVHFVDVFLLALLTLRVTGSRFIALTTGAYFIFPIFANEALLWFSTAVANSLSLFFLLLGFHLMISCSSIKKDPVAFVGAVS